MQLVPYVYVVVAHFPRQEQYALGDQLRRAVVSVPTNIAEGQARQHPREFAQALSIARGSLAEVDTLLLIAVSLGHVSARDIKAAQDRANSVRQLLQRLIQRIRADAERLRTTRGTPDVERGTTPRA
jgi:four helix bundle protein